MKTTLRAEITVWEVEVSAELCVWQRRPELSRLCAAVPEGGVLGPEIVDAALPGLSETARRNVVRHLEYLGLLEEDGTLGPAGRRCAAKGEAPAWELGVYRFLVAVHPLFDRCVLGFERLLGNGQDRDFDGLEALPAWFMSEPRRIWVSVLDSEKFTVSDLPTPRGVDPRCRLYQAPPAALAWEIDFDKGESRWALAGAIGEAGARRTFTTPERAVPDERVAVSRLFEAWESRWDAGARRVRMPYDGKASSGRDTFQRTFSYASVRAGAAGTFTDARVEDVPVGPGDAAEARRWALALIVPRVVEADAYLPRAGWAAAWAEVLSSTPLSGLAGDAPDPTSLPATIPPRARWLAAAACDLAVD